MTVVLRQMSFLVEGRDDVIIDLTKPAEEIKQVTIPVKEGCEYRIKLNFKVEREIVSGLKYSHSMSRKEVTVDKKSEIVGSYGPKEEAQSFTLSPEEAPKGMTLRGLYVFKSRFYDDDKNVYLEWEWSMDVQKDW